MPSVKPKSTSHDHALVQTRPAPATLRAWHELSRFRDEEICFRPQVGLLCEEVDGKSSVAVYPRRSTPSRVLGFSIFAVTQLLGCFHPAVRVFAFQDGPRVVDLVAQF